MGERTMDIQHFRYFLTVFQYCNISRAADEIHISRQSLSKIINEMEEEVHCPLFLRNARGLTPTDAGRAFYTHARQIVKEYEQIESINYLENFRRKEVIIYTFDAVTDFLGADFFIHFHETHPDIIICMIETTDEDARRKLLLGESDLAIVTDAVDLSNAEKTFLYKTRYCVIMSDQNPLCRKAAVAPEDYRNQRIIGKSQTLKYYWRDMNHTIQLGTDYSFFVELDNAAVREELVRRNEGIAVAWDYNVLKDRPPEGCAIRPMLYEGFGCNVYMLERRENGDRSRKIQIVKESIAGWIRTHMHTYA
ncbi:MAG: LysR family transcriptional regulator [Eubacterium sp.]